MEFASDTFTAPCPKCASPVDPHRDGGDGAHVKCGYCGWRGMVMLFRPMNLRVEEASAAMPDDAVCAHHENKRAVAVCSGSGSYICDLCLVDVNRQPYSAQYLDSVGRDVANKAFERYLPRPENYVVGYLILLLFLNFLAAFLAPVWLIHGFMKLSQARRLRREDPLYARVVGIWRIVLLGVLLGLSGGGAMLMIIAMFFA